MIFLNPTILFGLFAASIPLLIHLLNLRKIKKIEFSTLTFLKEIQKSKIKKIKIKQWLLLLIRTLIVLFLVSAFARPTLENVSIGGIASAAKTSAVFILDNSMSMGYVTENGSYFNKSKQVIKNVALQLQKGDDVSLVTTTSQKPLFTKNKNLSHFIRGLSTVEITDAAGSILDALLKATKLLQSSKNYNKEIYLFTDLQNNNFSKNKIQKLFLKITAYKTKYRRIKLYIFNMHKGLTLNTAITNFNSANQIFAVNRTIRFNATVTNFSNKPLTNNIVSLFIDGKRSAQQSINLPPEKSKQISFETKLSKAGLITAVVRLEDDNLNADNSRYLTLFIPKIIKVVIYTANPQDALYVKAALQNNYTQNISINIKRPEQYSFFAAKENSVNIFIGSKNFDLSLFKNGKRLPRSLIVFPSAIENSNSFNALIKALGFTNNIKIVNLNMDYLQFAKIDLVHPIFYDLFAKEKNVKIESPFINKYVKVLPNGLLKPIISLINNSIFLGEMDSQKSKMLLFTVAPTMGWSNFPLKPIFAPLIERSVYYLSASNKNNKTYFAGKPIDVNIKNLIIPNIKAVRPNGGEGYFPITKLNAKPFYKYRNTFENGIYRFYSDDKLIDFAAVNTDPAESINKYSNAKTFANIINKYKFYDNVIIITNYSKLKGAIALSRHGTELWRLFLIFAFIAAIVEMLISRSGKKDLGSLAEK